MNHFDYINGRLHAEGVPLDTIAAQVGTPFYCYSTATLVRHYTVFAEALSKAGLDATICFALKSNPNIAVVRTLAELGAGADVVSEGELRQALAAGVPPSRIVFSGVGKTRRELEFAVAKGIMQINVESEPELEALSDIAAARGVRMPIALRVNPDVDAGTHAKITTGKKENKFGIEWTRAHEVYRKAQSLPGIEVVGIACHIGSQLTDVAPFREAFLRVRDLVAILRADGIDIRRLDLGGGLGVPYENETPPHPDLYAEAIRATLGDLGCRIVLEPGRLLVGNAGIMVSRVVYMKEGATRTFAIVDAAMNDLMRPALYDAHHAILPVVQPDPKAGIIAVDVVGPVCETGDTFARQRPLPPLAEGDLLVFRTAGAYGAAMSSTYNSRPLIPEVLVKGDQFAIVRARPSYEEMLALESLPDWFG
ncbi:diaminopimelate decarboxylase [Magnetospirillum moscoviense]|uniref:Diaminopimelate decarboxylase n=1 Tax=Magnetospirillum moscoviense TaxID=1437059 RepID=A0A178MZ80_9PROT|nr:diaminopimelate decarboxylase [Magnetospirillum moscoviense]MBF0326618.1 diaminopimelate decarboxylase [Alphaproteobacteria bacterium]OAN65506.1 diaminopimelate decarboxylase [Magnetospirillum moscoviense]